MWHKWCIIGVSFSLPPLTFFTNGISPRPNFFHPSLLLSILLSYLSFKSSTHLYPFCHPITFLPLTLPFPTPFILLHNFLFPPHTLLYQTFCFSFCQRLLPSFSSHFITPVFPPVVGPQTTPPPLYPLLLCDLVPGSMRNPHCINLPPCSPVVYSFPLLVSVCLSADQKPNSIFHVCMQCSLIVTHRHSSFPLIRYDLHVNTFSVFLFQRDFSQ